LEIYNVGLISTYSTIPAIIIGLVKFRAAAYRPLFYFLLAGFCNDMLSIVLIKYTQTNVYNSNAYALIESLLLLWVFQSWKLYSNRTFLFLALSAVAVWVADNLILHKIGARFNSINRVYYCLITVMLCVNQLNKVILQEADHILMNSKFIICSCMMVFFTYSAIIEAFYTIDFQFTKNFYDSIILILNCLGILTNLGYAFALLWVPKRQTFILHF
jgi:hypothetical protein